MNAVRMQMDWRPVASLTEEDRGTPWERALAEVVLAEAVRQHNEDVKGKR